MCTLCRIFSQTRHGAQDCTLLARPEMATFMSSFNKSCPPALSDGEGLRLGLKSGLLPFLEHENPKITCTVVDGAAIIQILKPTSVKTFSDYAREIFIPYLAGKLESVSRLALV